MHPSALLLAWITLMPVFLSQPVPRLYVLLFMVSCAAVAMDWRRLRQLLRRSRWLLLAIVLVFSVMTPGTRMDMLPFVTSEGLTQALDHLSRLLLAIAMVAVLMSSLPPRELAAGIWGLLRPVQRFGIPAERIVVRLVLVIEGLNSPRPAVPEGQVRVALPAWRPRDGCGVLGAVIIAAVAVWS